MKSLNWLLIIWLGCLQISSFAFYNVRNVVGRSRISKNKELWMFSRQSRYLPPNFNERLAQGTMMPYELDKLFTPTKTEIDRMLEASSRGFMGCVFSVESSLVNLTEPFLISLSLLASDLDIKTPTLFEMKDVIGLSFLDMAISLGWSIAKEEVEAVSAHFYTLFHAVLEKTEVEAQIGVKNLLDNLLREGNQVAIVTNLPRELAVMALGKASISPLLEDRVSLDNFVFPCTLIKKDRLYIPQNPLYVTRYKQYIRACGLMRLPPVLTMAFEGNRKAVVEAKRVGLAVIATKDYAYNLQFLKGADKIVSSLEEVKLEDVYQMTKRVLKRSQGPEQLIASEVDMRTTRKQQTLTPMMDNKQGGLVDQNFNLGPPPPRDRPRARPHVRDPGNNNGAGGGRKRTGEEGEDDDVTEDVVE